MLETDLLISPVAVPPEAFLAGGGEMGAATRRHDWTRSGLGPVAQWPQSLRTGLGILLNSGYPMYIAWGPQFIQFYNDAYRPILGTSKHPGALGASTFDTFAEIWDFIGPMFQNVLATGTASTYTDQLLALHRHGYVEECYFTFSYSAILNEDGGVGGVLVTVLETTDRMLRERRLATLRDLRGIQSHAGTAGLCAAAAQVLARNRHDLPFAAVYRVEDGTCLLVEGEPIGVEMPAAVDLMRPGALPPLAEAAAAGGLMEWRPQPQTPADAVWPEPVHEAVCLPITPIGAGTPAAFLVAGISPRLALDSEYAEFFQSIGTTLSSVIAEATAYEQERRRAEMLAELDRAKTVFFSNVSHEFRTPLTLMLAPIEDLLAGEPAALPEPVRDKLQIAHRNALRLLKLVNSLLDFSRIEAGRVQASYAPTDLAEATRELAAVFRSAIEAAGLRLLVDCPPLDQDAYVDPEMWERIVLNLLSNAFKFTFDGSIEVQLRQRQDAAVLIVRDTGTGIPAEHLPRLFERFHRVPNARGRTHEGTGIGLALVNELVKLHGGTIEVESALDVGTTFRVSVPLGRALVPSLLVECCQDESLYGISYGV
jgi:signal transduction histidine kinase